MQDKLTDFKISGNITIEFYKKIRTLPNLDYLNSLVKMSIAPTLYEKKVGTLMTIREDDKSSLSTWKTYKDELAAALKVQYIELKDEKNYTVILFYDKRYLEATLKQERVKKFLKSIGYENSHQINNYLLKLKDRFREQVPDEVGIFLGYHFEDVVDFYFNSGKACLVCGYWKCFNNKNRALYDFKRYNLAKENYMKSLLYQ